MKNSRSRDLFDEDIHVASIPTSRVRWSVTYRLIQSRFPPINLFERVAPREDWDALIALESLTNPRLRDEAGNIALVPKERRISGSGASYVMAPFTHVSKDRATRFSTGNFGVYYAAHTFETALCEVGHHLERFHKATNDPATATDYRVLQGKIDKSLHDIRGSGFEEFIDPHSYARSQLLASALRNADGNGIVYPSVRHPGGECFAAFWPDVVSIPVQANHARLEWDGTRLSRWFDFTAKVWYNIDAPKPPKGRRKR